MAGKHRGPSPETTQMIRLPTSKRILAAVKQIAAQEQRSLGNMVHVLLLEALQRRKVL